MDEYGITDFHHHVYPQIVVDEVERSGTARPPTPAWAPAISLEFMEKTGIARSVISVDDSLTAAAPPHALGRLARSCNECLAGLAADFPGQFIPLATLPLPDVEAALRELDYAVGTLKHAGVCVMSNVRGVYLGSGGQDELFAELDRRAVPIMIHPSLPPAGVLDPRLEYTHDVARAVANLMYQGVLERYPRLFPVLAHAGGTLPYIRDRVLAVGLESYIERKAFVSLLFRYRRRRSILRRMYLDLTGATDQYSLAAINGTFDSSRLLYGSGFPSCSPAEAVAAQQKLGSKALAQNCRLALGEAKD